MDVLVAAEEQHAQDRDRRDLAHGARQIFSGFAVRMIARVLLIMVVAKLFRVDVFGRLGETDAISSVTAGFAMARIAGFDFVRWVSFADTLALARRSFPIALHETSVFATPPS